MIFQMFPPYYTVYTVNPKDASNGIHTGNNSAINIPSFCCYAICSKVAIHSVTELDVNEIFISGSPPSLLE